MQREIRLLRIRFVVLVILIVTSVMGLIFGAICHFTSVSLEDSGYDMLESIAQRPFQFGSFTKNTADINLPYFVLETDRNFAILTKYGGYYDLSDTRSIQSALQYATKSSSDRGYISQYNLRFLKVDHGNGTYTIAFADVSSQMEVMIKVRTLSTVICVIGIAVFALLAAILSKWVVRPVENSWQQQKQFVSDASHELKTPLTVITTNAEMLQLEENSDEDRKKYTNNIVTVSHQMRNLVEDMLNLARVEKGEKQTFDRINMSDSVNNTLLQFEPVMFELGLDLVENIENNVFVKGNSQRLEQLLGILLDNAGKYSKPGEVVVSLAKQGKNAVLTVSNPSDSFTDQQLKDIFKRFFRADEAHNEKGSYGLGLSIAKSICEAHGGKIRAEYNDGIIKFIASVPSA